MFIDIDSPCPRFVWERVVAGMRRTCEIYGYPIDGATVNILFCTPLGSAPATQVFGLWACKYKEKTKRRWPWWRSRSLWCLSQSRLSVLCEWMETSDRLLHTWRLPFIPDFWGSTVHALCQGMYPIRSFFSQVPLIRRGFWGGIVNATWLPIPSTLWMHTVWLLLPYLLEDRGLPAFRAHLLA